MELSMYIVDLVSDGSRSTIKSIPSGCNLSFQLNQRLQNYSRVGSGPATDGNVAVAVRFTRARPRTSV